MTQVISKCIGYRSEIPTKLQGEIQAAICDGITSFQQEYMGRGPKDIHAHLIGDLLVVRLRGVLTAAEQQLVKSVPSENANDEIRQSGDTDVHRHSHDGGRP